MKPFTVVFQARPPSLHPFIAASASARRRLGFPIQLGTAQSVNFGFSWNPLPLPLGNCWCCHNPPSFSRGNIPSLITAVHAAKIKIILQNIQNFLSIQQIEYFLLASVDLPDCKKIFRLATLQQYSLASFLNIPSIFNFLKTKQFIPYRIGGGGGWVEGQLFLCVQVSSPL